MDEINGRLTIEVTDVDGRGLLVALNTSGDYSSESIDSRFYSITEPPPPDISPDMFWSIVMAKLAQHFLRNAAAASNGS